MPSKGHRARCGGKTKIRGLELGTAMEAEESAAEKALTLLESSFKLTIVDKNYAERIDAKEQHLFITNVLRNFLDLSSG